MRCEGQEVKQPRVLAAFFVVVVVVVVFNRTSVSILRGLKKKLKNTCKVYFMQIYFLSLASRDLRLLRVPWVR